MEYIGISKILDQNAKKYDTNRNYRAINLTRSRMPIRLYKHIEDLIFVLFVNSSFQDKRQNFENGKIRYLRATTHRRRRTVLMKIKVT